MSNDALISAVSRLESVATRLENLALAQPSGGSGSSSSDEEAAFVTAYDGIVNGSLAKYLALSQSIGGDVKEQSAIVQAGFQELRQFLVTASKWGQPSQSDLQAILKPISEKIMAVQEYREKNRKSKFFNHLSTLSESIPALGWVAVSPLPGPYVGDMLESGQFYSNRVLKDYKEQDQQHVDWAKTWTGLMKELQAYIKQYHTTGVVWNKNKPPATPATPAPSGGAPPPPPPPPPPAAEGAAAPPAAKSKPDTSQLFSQINQGTDITKGLKKVTDDMKTHKNPELRIRHGPLPFKSAGPAPFKPGAPPKTAPKPEANKPPVTELRDKKWIVEYHNNNNNIVIEGVEPKQVVYVYKCTNSTIQVKGKVNSIFLDGCKKTGLVVDDVVSAVEFVNCQSVRGQVLGKVPTVSIDKTDGCMMYLSKDSVNAEIISAKSSEMNVLVPGQEEGDYKEFPLPEQFRSTWDGKKFVTTATESV